MSESHRKPSAARGRGAVGNSASQRFDGLARTADGDWLDEREAIDGQPLKLRTEVTIEQPRTIITRNQSPDIPFDRSINAYRGCEHGCIYCFARPTHAYLNLSPGLDFESRLFAKPSAAALLRAELSKRGYTPAPIALGTNTDPYQPIEARFKITRQLLEIMSEFNHPVTITTKSARIVRDLDILAAMAERQLVAVMLSVTTLDPAVARHMEPRASAPAKRLAAVRALADAGIPTFVSVSPIIPAITDHEIEAILEAAAAAGALGASWLLVRLPHEVSPLFREWLDAHFPDRAARVMSHITAARGGRDNDPDFYNRFRPQGAYVEMLRRRFAVTCRRLGLSQARIVLQTDLFGVPGPRQLTLL